VEANEAINKITKRNKALESLLSENVPMIGIYWVNMKKKELKFVFGDPLSETPSTDKDDFIDGRFDHYSIWERLRKNNVLPKNWKLLEYVDIPRGRVLYSKVVERFIVYTNHGLVLSDWHTRLVLKEFNLQDEITDFISDEHYELP